MKGICLIHIIFLTAWFNECQSQLNVSTTTDSSTTITTTIPTTTPIPSYNLGIKNITWHPKSTEKIIINIEEGYKISATITACEIRSENNEFATLSTGKNNETLLISYKVANSPSFLYDRTTLYANFTGTRDSNLTIVFSRVGDEITTTTTEITSSTVYLPTPSINDTYELTVDLSGVEAYEYRHIKTLNAFKNMIANMARDYSREQRFDLLDDITIDNVQIIEIVACYHGWQTCHPCAEVTFAVPIHTNQNADPWNGYQLNGKHLAIMWERYENKYLTDGIITCNTPDVNKWFTWQVLVCIIVTGIIFILMLVLRYYTVQTALKAGRANKQMSEATPTAQEDNISEISLQLHYLQDTPRLFDNMFPMFDPDTMID